MQWCAYNTRCFLKRAGEVVYFQVSIIIGGQVQILDYVSIADFNQMYSAEPVHAVWWGIFEHHIYSWQNAHI